MNTRPPESLIWRNLIVLPSMDVISSDMMNDLCFQTENYSALKAELRNTIKESDLDSNTSYALWDNALQKIEATLGRRVRSDFEQWGLGFPCDSDAVLRELDAWERTWPDLVNTLRSSPSVAPWGDRLASDYRSAVRNQTFDQKLEGRLADPLSEWDKACFSRYANEDLMSESEFFTPLIMGADRLRLCQFWKHASTSLSAAQKQLVWQLGSDVWSRMHGSMNEADLKMMRAEYGDEESFQKALSALNSFNPKPIQLPSPDIMLSYV